MGQYLKLFQSHTQYNTYINGDNVFEPNVCYCDNENEVHYNPIDFSKQYLTFIPTEDSTFTFTTNALQYSLDDGATWTSLTAGTASPTVAAGSKILWKQTGLTPTSSAGIGTFSSTGNFIAQGNIMSLYYGDNFVGETDLTGKNYAFYSLFYNCRKLVGTKDLSLPATTLTTNCYYEMFYGCTSLTTAPELPATTLATNCYYWMFSDCTSLTTAPKLPATTLASSCYTYMFGGCESLVTAPVLPATTLTEGCYSDMFRGCTSLTTAPALPATTLASQCYQYMFSGCTSLTTAPQLSATTLASGCYQDMFDGCTSLTTAPQLPATTLANYCYQYMFNGCTSLTTAPSTLPATTLADYCYQYMFSGCTSLTTAPSTLPATTLAQYCYSSMFHGCTSLTTAPTLPATALTNKCYSNMFEGCTSLTTAPTLPAPTLVNNCYSAMFYGCSNLNYIKALFTTTPSSSYTSNWVNGVAATGTFVIDYNATWYVTGVNGIPTGWTVELENYSYTPSGCALQYLKTTALESGTIGFKIPSAVTTTNVTSISYSTDNGTTWTDTDNTSSLVEISVNVDTDDNILWKGTAQKLGTSQFYGTARFNVEGNVMSLLYGDDFADKHILNYTYQFNGLFRSSKVVNASNLSLPSDRLRDYCYQEMFDGCTSLTTAPQLPATTLATQCYSFMFRDCTSLTNAPELPATTLADSCYYGMFRSCTSLVTAPQLPATTLANNCYNYMFSGCTNLNYIKAMFTTTPSSSYTSNWVNGVAATGTFVKNYYALWNVTGVNGIPTGWTVEYENEPSYTPSGYALQYLKTTALESGTIGFKIPSAVTTTNVTLISYSTDNGTTWTDTNNTSSLVEISVNVNNGDSILWKGTAQRLATSDSNYSQFYGTASFNVEGNIMSMCYGDDFANKHRLDYTYQFNSLFRGSKVVNASNLSLPADRLHNYCYQYMFYNCSSLTTAPTLPATTLATRCYYRMFAGCTSLVNAPQLPATTLAIDCYEYMFTGCTSLVTAPNLPATTLSDYCYYYMFSGCTSLTTAPTLPATTLEDYCYQGMFLDCTSLTTAPKLPATTLSDYCYKYMFSGCTSLTTAPKLTATTLATECYREIFNGCTSLTTAPALPATTLTQGCYYEMFTGCTSLTTSPTLPATTLTSGCYYGMFNGCTSLTTAPKLPATTLAINCYREIFNGCTSLTTAPSTLPATTLSDYCYYDMFNGCTSLTTAPQLPATTLATYCYYRMFQGCSSLNYIKAMFTTTPSDTYTQNWVDGVAATGTFVMNYNATWNVRGVNGIPNGWMLECENDQYVPSGYALQYLKTTALESGTIEFNNYNGTGNITSVSYSTDNGATWTTNNSITLNVTANQSVLWKGTAQQLATNSGAYSYFDGTARFNVEGNVMSLLYGDDFADKHILNYTYQFKTLFKDTKVVNASNLSLTADRLTDYCYQEMFSGCTYLTTAPALPATTLTKECYEFMFNGCTSLTTAPTLPATTLADACYNSIFSNCTSLTTAPQLPATTLANTCYYGMFDGCTSLTTAPTLNATTLAESCYSIMFEGCTSLTTAPTLPATTLATDCYHGMFQGCTSLTTAPTLSVTTLTSGCYEYMFSGCTSLTTAPQLPATTLASECYRYMFYGCTSLTTAPQLPATTLATECYNSMFRDCTSLNSITCLATNISATDCTSYWVQNVAASGTFTKATRMSSWTTGDNGIPNGWTIENSGINYDEQYLKTTALESGTITFTIPANVTTTNVTSISYSTDNGTTWTTTNNTSRAVTITVGVMANQEVLWKGAAQQFATSTNTNYYSNFGGTASFNVDGNVMSLCYGDNFVGEPLNKTYQFSSLFKTSKVVDASNLSLPAPTLTSSCYRFMFQGCRSLTTVPQLPATTLATYCYYGMFTDCGSLTTAPILPATTLTSYCYYQMFAGCRLLNSITCLATNISASNSRTNWVSSVASSGTFTKAANVSWPTGTSGIPSGWTVQTASE